MRRRPFLTSPAGAEYLAPWVSLYPGGLAALKSVLVQGGTADVDSCPGHLGGPSVEPPRRAVHGALAEHDAISNFGLCVTTS